MLMQGIHADVTIVTGENDKTPAHRAVLVSITKSPSLSAFDI
jgi:speckle-type POZ protein